MRIGALAKQYNISIETIRYYISIGLLIPEKKGAQFQFSAQEEEILAMIQHLKSLRFKLSEIRCIIDLKRTSNWVEPATQKAYVRLLREKDGEIGSEIVGLQYVQKQIHKEIKNCVPASTCRSTAGVPIRALPLLCCPWCGRQLTIRSGEFSYKYVTSGELVCPCGYCAHIQDGIVNTGKAYTGTHDSPDLNRNLYHTLNVDFVRMYQLCCNKITHWIASGQFAGKVIFENFINGYFYLYNHLADLPKDALYIVADKYPEMLQMYKEMISTLGLDLDILYIADCDPDYPLRPGCVDLVIDFFSSSEHDFYFPQPYYEAFGALLAPDAQVIGTVMTLPAGAKSRPRYHQKYPEGTPHLMDFSHLEGALSALGYAIKTEEVGAVLKTQDKFSFVCHLSGEKMSFLWYTASRTPK